MNATNVGYLAGLLTTSSFIPQIWKSYTIMRFNANIKNKKIENQVASALRL
jgi:uncharacterized protein with PQ loop repeat